MHKYTKLALTMMLLVSASSLVQAKDSGQNKKATHQRPSFTSIDTNSDGDIDFDEFSSQELPQGDHQIVFDIIDTDSNGVISNEEFVNHKPPPRKKRQGERS